jgi:hypothetical protein
MHCVSWADQPAASPSFAHAAPVSNRCVQQGCSTLPLPLGTVHGRELVPSSSPSLPGAYKRPHPLLRLRFFFGQHRASIATGLSPNPGDADDLSIPFFSIGIPPKALTAPSLPVQEPSPTNRQSAPVLSSLLPLNLTLPLSLVSPTPPFCKMGCCTTPLAHGVATPVPRHCRRSDDRAVRHGRCAMANADSCPG